MGKLFHLSMEVRGLKGLAVTLIALTAILLASFFFVGCAGRARDFSQLKPKLDDLLAKGIRPNELGMVMIIEYHWIGKTEGDNTRSVENFRKDLERLYEEGYRLVRFTDLMAGKVNTPPGTTPVVLSFDDSPESQFRYIRDVDGKTVIDPDCALGMLRDFSRKHPDFGFTGLFNVLPSMFEQEEYARRKIKYLSSKGFEFGNHTENHYALGKISEEEIRKEIVLPIERMEKIDPSVKFVTLCLPYNSKPKNERILFSGSFRNRKYSYRWVVGANSNSPFYPAYHRRNPGKIIPRVLAVDYDPSDGSGYRGSDYWIKYFQKHPELRYVSDGDPKTVCAPSYMRHRLLPRKMPPGVEFKGY